VLERLAIHEATLSQPLSFREKEYFILQTKGEIYLEQNHFYLAHQHILKSIIRKPENAKILKLLLTKTALMIEAQQTGVKLKMRERSLSEQETKLLKLVKPYQSIPDFLENLILSSTQYLNNFQTFSSDQKGIIYMLYRRHFKGAFYSLIKLLATTEENKDWYFFICIFEQLARICEIPPAGFVNLILKDQTNIKEWSTDIKLYAETIYQHLLEKPVPDIADSINSKANDLTEKLQSKKNVKWSTNEWQATYYRAQAYTYSKKKYYPEIYHAAIAAKGLSDSGIKDIESYIRKYKKFVHAKELGKRLSKIHRPYIKADNETTIQYTFQLSSKPTLYKEKKRRILDQLGIEFSGDVSEGSSKLISIIGPDAVLFKGAKKAFLSEVLEKLDRRIVKKIIFQDCLLDEGLPPVFFTFQELRYLSISGGGLQYISEDFINLSKLNYLNLSNLKELKKLPTSFNNLKELTHVQLYLEEIDSLPELKHCEKISRLSIANTKTNKFPEEICELQNLEFLDLRNNKFTSIPKSIENLKKLKNLKIEKNPWEQLPEQILHIPTLTELELEEDQIKKLAISEELKTAFWEKVKATKVRQKNQDEFYKNIGK